MAADEPGLEPVMEERGRNLVKKVCAVKSATLIEEGAEGVLISVENGCARSIWQGRGLRWVFARVSEWGRERRGEATYRMYFLGSGKS